MSTRLRDMDAAAVRVRADHARSLLALAELSADDPEPGGANASASNAVLAAIAAVDALCGARLGQCAQGSDHRQAVDVLRRAGGSASTVTAFRRLVDAKSLVQYGTGHVSGTRAADLLRSAQRVVAEMEHALRR